MRECVSEFVLLCAVMALNRLVGLGVGLAVTGAVVKSTLYNGTTAGYLQVPTELL